jgi:hypothetical protein
VVRWPVAALLVLLSGCAAAPLPLPSAGSKLVAEEHTTALTFDYPSGWSNVSWGSFPSSFSYMVAALSNQRLHSPCVHHGNVFSCGQPLGRLQPAAMLVEWWEDGFPGWQLADQPGAAISVDGVPAKMERGPSASPNCRGLGASLGISVVVARPQAPGNYFQFIACLRGPQLSRETSLALEMLDSARLSFG